MYTSGSTGRPKGVLIPHRAVVRLVLRHELHAARTGRGRVAQSPTSGIRRRHLRDLGRAAQRRARWWSCRTRWRCRRRALAGRCERHGVTDVFLTTALFNQIARAMPPDAFRHGAAGRCSAARRSTRAGCGGCCEHGAPRGCSTSTGRPRRTTFATWHGSPRLPEQRDDGADRPARSPTREVYVLDARSRAGAGRRAGRAVHRRRRGWRAGTSNRPELTAERFVPDPFAATRRRGCTAPATWRATGRRRRSSSSAASIARSRCAASGSSRARSRPRWRGCPGVARPVVVAARTRPATTRLVALRGPGAAACRRTRRLCGATCDATLPDYMLPAAFVRCRRCRSPPTARSTARRCRRPRPSPTSERLRRAAARTMSRTSLAGHLGGPARRRARRRARRLLRARRPLAARRAAGRRDRARDRASRCRSPRFSPTTRSTDWRGRCARGARRSTDRRDQRRRARGRRSCSCMATSRRAASTAARSRARSAPTSRC